MATSAASRRFSPVAALALALALMPVAVSGQAPSAARDHVVWHWFGDCPGSDSLVLEVRLDDRSLYTATFHICKVRRAQIKPEPQQRLLAFRFDAVPRRFRPQNPLTEPQPVAGTIWEAGGDRHAIRLGVSFATDHQVLLNTQHVARAEAASRSERVRGLVIATRPVRHRDRTPPSKP